MDFGVYLRSFLTDPTRPLYEQIDDLIEICHVVRDGGYASVAMPQHWFSHPTIWPHPYAILGRLAPETGSMRMMTGILLLPLHNPVDIAEVTATLDHVTKGRFTLGLGLGYREAELEAAGITRKDRVPRMTEGIELMKKLWSGEDVEHEGRYWKVKGKMGFTPVQKPHPPIWIACQSEGAVRRAARIADACFLAPQVGFEDLKPLIAAYHDERAQNGLPRGTVALSRGVSFAGSREQAVAEAKEAAESSYRTYSTWNMQEDTMVQIHVSPDSDIADWAVVGDFDECQQRFQQLQDDLGVDLVSMTLLNLPKGLQERKDYLQAFSENVVRRMR